jgi:hypothetical protein
MSIENDGGPAYPVPDVPLTGTTTDSWLSHYRSVSDGMSVRDVLACHALEGLLASGCRMSEAGKCCWIAADEALAARTEPSAIDLLRKQHAMMMAALKTVAPLLDDADVAMRLTCDDQSTIDSFITAIRKVRDVLVNLK